MSTDENDELARLRLFAEQVSHSQSDTPGTRAAATYALTGSLVGVVEAMQAGAERRIVGERVTVSTQGRVVARHDSHGLCYEVILDQLDFDEERRLFVNPGEVW